MFDILLLLIVWIEMGVMLGWIVVLIVDVNGNMMCMCLVFLYLVIVCYIGIGSIDDVVNFVVDMLKVDLVVDFYWVGEWLYLLGYEV